jgi:beta-glucosidase
MRLLGFERIELQPGESRQITITADRRLLGRFDGDARQWHVAEGIYKVAVGRAADDFVLKGETTLAEARFGS